MNAARRKEIARIVALIDSAKSALDDLTSSCESVRDEEQDYYDAMPESLQGSDKGQRAEEACGMLDTACDKVSEAIDALDEAVSELNNAAE